MTDFYWTSADGMSRENEAARLRRDLGAAYQALAVHHARLVRAEVALQAGWEVVSAAQQVLDVFRTKDVPPYSDEAQALARLARALEGL